MWQCGLEIRGVAEGLDVNDCARKESVSGTNAGETLSVIPMRNGLDRQEAFDHTEISDEGFRKD